MRTVGAVGLLLAVLAFAIVRPRRLPEAVAAVPAALLAVALGLVPVRLAVHELGALGPTVGFLAAVLVFAQLAADAGVFDLAGTLAARASRGSPRRLLAVVFAVAAVVTAALSLDATVVLLTPVVFRTAALLSVRARPHVYACTHLANSASLLLPVSNLTNLLAFAASGLSFVSFTGLMAVPWLAVIAVEYLVFRRFFAADLGTPTHAVAPPAGTPPPVYALSVLAATLVGFAVAEPFGIAPAWVAAAGAVVLAARRVRRPADLLHLLRAANPGFLAFVFGLGVVVLAVRRAGLADLVGTLVPGATGLLALLAVALLAAVLANLVNNLPATLILVPVVATRPGLVLAVLLGVNIGPNLTYVGSLATLLWRRILHAHDARPAAGEFLRLGASTVPAGLVVATVALWCGLRLTGIG
ncbi:SLC13 family permease [Actinocatenispora sera]|uniref:SLC13 family permease n=1 Tax=Actinocatenispora sera TaxID=390989 RepID=UPI0033C6757E